MLHYNPEALPLDKVTLLQKWLAQSEYRLLREQILALAVEKTIEATAALTRSLDNEGGAMETAKQLQAEARKLDEMLILLNEIATGNKSNGDKFQYKRAKVTIEQV